MPRSSDESSNGDKVRETLFSVLYFFSSLFPFSFFSFFFVLKKRGRAAGRFFCGRPKFFFSSSRGLAAFVAPKHAPEPITHNLSRHVFCIGCKTYPKRLHPSVHSVQLFNSTREHEGCVDVPLVIKTEKSGGAPYVGSRYTRPHPPLTSVTRVHATSAQRLGVDHCCCCPPTRLPELRYQALRITNPCVSPQHVGQIKSTQNQTRFIRR